MKKIIALLPMAIATFVLISSPYSALAHEHYTFEINGQQYEVVIGSLNEPITVDDKTGVDFRISKEGAPVNGLDFKVELQAGDQTKILSLEPAHGNPGAYKAQYYPTVATTISYRIFGDIDGATFDYTFTCNPAHPEGNEAEDNDRVAVSENIFRIARSGSYGCPAQKANQGFPETSASLNELTKEINKPQPQTKTNIALVLGLSGLVIGIGALIRKK